MIYLFIVLFLCRILSYFDKPDFIIYDEWFDDNLTKTKFEIHNKKTQDIENFHEYFYEQSNYKIGASENNLKIDLKINKKEIISSNFSENISEEYTLGTRQKISFFETLPKGKINFRFTKNLIYFFSIFAVIFIVGFIMFSKNKVSKNESNITNKIYIQ